MSGPVIAVATFAVWVLVLIMGMGLVTWAMRDSFHFSDTSAQIGLLDSVYFAGSTLSVLGPGDIVAVTGSAELLTIGTAALGFAMFFGSIAHRYLADGVSEAIRQPRINDADRRVVDGIRQRLRTIDGDRLEMASTEVALEMAAASHSFFDACGPGHGRRSVARTASRRPGGIPNPRSGRRYGRRKSLQTTAEPDVRTTPAHR